MSLLILAIIILAVPALSLAYGADSRQFKTPNRPF